MLFSAIANRVYNCEFRFSDFLFFSNDLANRQIQYKRLAEKLVYIQMLTSLEFSREVVPARSGIIAS